MSKITLSNVGSLIDATTAAATINANSAVIQTAMDNTLSRDGTTPNTMLAQLDMNSNQILNLPAPATAFSPVRLQDVQTGGTVTNIPAGGTTGQVLAKTSNTDYQVGWTSESAELTAGTNIVLTGSTPTTISTTTTPTFTTVNTATVPTTVDTLVARNTTDTLANKTLTAPVSNNGTFNSPTLVTPTLGVASATSVNKVTITPPATSATLTIPDTVVMTGPAASGTVMTLGNNETVTGVKTFGAAGNVGKLSIAGTTSGTTVVNATAVASGTLTLPATTDTLVGKATTDTLTNKTFNSTGTGNTLQVSGVTVSSGQYPGETTTGSATAGNVGEIISSNIVKGSAVTVTTSAVAQNLTSISLTAGDWDVYASPYFLPAATTSITALDASISNNVSATLDLVTQGAFSADRGAAYVPGNVECTVPVGPVRISLSGTTTIFCVILAVFTASTMQCYGGIRARRVR